ncbi:hypothetical protein [Saccharibacillus kuerlensis]|uniref:Uncharacterized protein n=1 Tax=Saccharibacillus kuerlensis TaxID=459527 RepID=A0ABQ2L8F6_9BACL|nr:hypothetical protein [Saccharibacillus kuerlensis]GGO06704.1 hypothetical protein GCM10010969_34550 [Saccharibacillus kuerlensis]
MNKTARMMSLASALLLTFALTACGEANAPAPEPGEVPTNTTQEPPAENGQTDKTDHENHKAISASGVYNGQADPHTIEVDVDGKPMSFQLAQGVAKQLDGLTEGDAISFEYVEHPVEGSDVPQMEIQSLEKTDETSASEGANTSGDSASVSQRPATQSFEMMSEGMPDKRTAQLEQGDGYSLYVFDAYTFDSAQNRLMLTAFPEYHADIEVLPDDFDRDELRTQGMTELEKYGEVNEYEGDQLFEGPMSGANLFLQVSNEEGLHNYIVWEPENGGAFLFRVHVPSGEPSETFLTPALTSLSSIESDSKN